MKMFTVAQLKLLADFFSNLAVVWFAAALIAPADFLVTLKAILSGTLSIYIGLTIIKEVEI